MPNISLFDLGCHVCVGFVWIAGRLLFWNSASAAVHLVS